MHAETLSIRIIFGQDRRHIVPLFQRPYVWEKSLQWEPLWEDVRTVADRLLNKIPVRPHFLGAIVLDHVPKPTGHIETRLIIDGQQRLTTIQLLLEAFSDICERCNSAKYSKALFKLTRNDDPLSVEEDDQFKVWPTNTDQEHFRRVMLVKSPEELKQAYGRKLTVDMVGHPIADAYLFFYHAIWDWVSTVPTGLEERLEALYMTIREFIRLVVIDLDEKDDAQMIFETLNARGTPLLPSDLVKNYLFHQARLQGENIDKLYISYWKEFDDQGDYWRERQGIGHATRARLDNFLLYFLTMKRRDLVPVAHLYNAFRDYAHENVMGATTILQELRTFASVFLGFDHFPKGSREWTFFRRLSAMDYVSVYPFLLEVFARHRNSPEILHQILQDIESFLVRRMICQLNTRGYGKLFVDLLGAFSQEGGAPHERVRQFLLAGDAETTRWPDDEEFRAAWEKFPIYHVLVRRRVIMILEALENHLHDPKTEKLEFLDKLTVEHLMPRQWLTAWPLPESIPAEEARLHREEVIHTIGNLTLVNNKLNPSLSNGPWQSKREAILKFSALSLNRFFQDKLNWDEKSIEDRTWELYLRAIAIWPKP